MEFPRLSLALVISVVGLFVFGGWVITASVPHVESHRVAIPDTTHRQTSSLPTIAVTRAWSPLGAVATQAVFSTSTHPEITPPETTALQSLPTEQPTTTATQVLTTTASTSRVFVDAPVAENASRRATTRAHSQSIPDMTQTRAHVDATTIPKTISTHPPTTPPTASTSSTTSTATGDPASPVPTESAPSATKTRVPVKADPKYMPRTDCDRDGCHSVQYPGPTPPKRTRPEDTLILPSVCIDSLPKKQDDKLHRVGGTAAATVAECRLLCINSPMCIAWSHGSPSSAPSADEDKRDECGLFGQLLCVDPLTFESSTLLICTLSSLSAKIAGRSTKSRHYYPPTTC